jgi:hypothetical protein
VRMLPPRWKTPEQLFLFRAKRCGKKQSYIRA